MSLLTCHTRCCCCCCCWIIPCLGAAHGADQAGSGWDAICVPERCVWAHVWHSAKDLAKNTHTHAHRVWQSPTETEISFPSLRLIVSAHWASHLRLLTVLTAAAKVRRLSQRLATLATRSLRWLLSLTAAQRRLLRRLDGGKRRAWPALTDAAGADPQASGEEPDTCTNTATGHAGHGSLHSSTGGQSDLASVSLPKKSGYFRVTHTHALIHTCTGKHTCTAGRQEAYPVVAWGLR